MIFFFFLEALGDLKAAVKTSQKEKERFELQSIITERAEAPKSAETRLCCPRLGVQHLSLLRCCCVYLPGWICLHLSNLSVVIFYLPDS